MTARCSALALSLILTATGTRAEPPAEAPEGGARVVLRISRAFLADLTRQQFEQDQPIRTTADGATVVGCARVAGGFRVKLYASETASEFDLLVDGAVATRVEVTRKPVRVLLNGSAPFHASRRVAFDGTTFTPRPTCVGACYRSCLDAICTLRNGPAAPLVRRLARPVVLRSLPDADQKAGQDVRAQIGNEVTQKTDHVIEILNEVLAIREGVHEFLRRQGVPVDRYRVTAAATEESLLAGFGFPAGESPRPPAAAGPPRARVEIWVRHRLGPLLRMKLALAGPTLEKQWAERLKPKIRERIAQHSPELATVVDEATHEIQLNPIPEEPDWHVIRFSKRVRAENPPAP